MKNLVREINKKDKSTIEKVAIIHGKFEQIHPFSDGNGRIGRLIMAAMLLRKNFAPAIIEQQTKLDYYKYLQAAQQKQENDSLIEHIADAILVGYKIFGS